MEFLKPTTKLLQLMNVDFVAFEIKTGEDLFLHASQSK